MIFMQRWQHGGLSLGTSGAGKRGRLAHLGQMFSRVLEKLGIRDAGMEETLHLMRDPANSARLLRSLREADEGRFVEHDIDG